MELNQRSVPPSQAPSASSLDHGSAAKTAAERRRKPRVAVEFTATVRGVDAAGEAFEESPLLDNLSASGLFFKVARQLEPGTSLFVVFPFPTAPTDKVPPPRVAVRGVVRRVVPQADGTRGVGVSFQHHRLL